ncbi:hypothetical protein IJG98_00080 [Candidatus Saccharibacteria bacterium]|nr:hypothetical protein [Candidatus Saccharibacteria bacterium]
MPIHTAEVGEVATDAEVDIGGLVDGDGRFVPEFAAGDGVGRNPTVGGDLVGGAIGGDDGFAIAGVGNRGEELGFFKLVFDFVGALGNGAKFVIPSPDGGGNENARDENRGGVDGEKNRDASLFDQGSGQNTSLLLILIIQNP